MGVFYLQKMAGGGGGGVSSTESALSANQEAHYCLVSAILTVAGFMAKVLLWVPLILICLRVMILHYLCV